MCDLYLTATVFFQEARRLLMEFTDHPGFSRSVLTIAGLPCYAMLVSGIGAVSTWRALAAYESRERGVNVTVAAGDQLPQLMHGSLTRIHAEREIAFFFNPKDAGLGATAPPTISIADGARAQSEGDAADACLVGREVLARWGQDGWFFPVRVHEYLSNEVVCVRDADGSMECLAVSALIPIDACPQPSAENNKVRRGGGGGCVCVCVCVCV